MRKNSAAATYGAISLLRSNYCSLKVSLTLKLVVKNDSKRVLKIRIIVFSQAEVFILVVIYFRTLMSGKYAERCGQLIV